MQLIINDTNNLTDLDIKILGLLLPAGAQPAVAQNTGTTGEGVSTFRLPDCGVSDGAADTADTGVVADAAPSAPEKPKRTRKAKEAEVAAEPVGETPAEVVSTAETEPTPATDTASASESSDAPALTVDDIRGALQIYTGKHGMPKAIELLKKYNAGRISEVKSDDYADFVKDCNE